MIENIILYTSTNTLLLDIAKSCREVVDNTLTKPQETLEFKMETNQQTVLFTPPIMLPEKWLMSLVSLEVYN